MAYHSDGNIAPIIPDLIEIGVPFSDPTADGPAIQRAAERSLRGGTTLAKVLDTVRALAAEGMTMILATHEMAFAQSVADRVCFLHQGRILRTVTHTEPGS